MSTAHSSDRSGRLAWWYRFAPEAVALVLTLAMFAQEFTPLDGYDWLRMHVWHKAAYQHAWMSGELLHWNPFVSLGRPALAEIEAAFFYPPNLVFLLGPAAGLVVCIWLHLAWLLRGMRRLMSTMGVSGMGAWLAALTFAVGAPLLGRLQSGQIQVFCTLAWLPFLLVWGADLARNPTARSAIKMAMATGLAVLAGSPPMLWIMCWAVLGWMACQILSSKIRPTVGRLVGCSMLSLVGALALSAGQVLPFLELVHQGNRGGGEAAFVLGDQIAGQSWSSLWRSRPPEQVFYWEYNLYSGVLAFALALSTLVLRPRGGGSWWIIGLVFGGLALGTQTPLLPALVEWVPGWDAWRYPSRYAIVSTLAIAVLAGLGLDRFRSIAQPHWPQAIGVGLVIVVINTADLGRACAERQAAYGHIPPHESESALAELMTGQRSDAAFPPRILAPNWVVRENAGMQAGFSSISGFANPVLGNVWQAIHQAADVEPDPADPVNLPPEVFAAPLKQFESLGLDYGWNPVTEKFTPFEGNRLRVVVGSGEVVSTHFSPDRITVQVATDVPTELVLAEPWYPGWRATVNGEPAEILQTEGWKRAVGLPAGNSELIMTYRSRWFGWGAGISLVSLATMGMAWRRFQDV